MKPWFQKERNMFLVENKFEIGEECYATYRKAIHHTCPVCNGKGRYQYNGFDLKCNNCNGTGSIHHNKEYEIAICRVKVKLIRVSRQGEQNMITYKLKMLDSCSNNVNSRREENLFKTYEDAMKSMEVN